MNHAGLTISMLGPLRGKPLMKIWRKCKAMKVHEIVRLALENPSLDEGEAMDIAWEYTGFPSFFIGSPVKTFWKQLRRFYRASIRSNTQGLSHDSTR